MIEISEVINWLRNDSVVSRRGPNSIVLFADFYDYEMTTQVWQLPDDKDAVINSMKEILDSLVDPDAEDNSIKLILKKENIIIGMNNLDISNDILKLLNEKINDISLK